MFLNSLYPIPPKKMRPSLSYAWPEWAFDRILDDTQLLADCLALKKKLIDISRQKRVILIIGIGGSSMGTLAILQAYYGIEQPEHIKWYCADTFEEEYTKNLLHKIEEHLKAGDQIITCVISKSGTTTETLVNASLFITLLQRYNAQVHESIVIISNEHSPLHKLAQEQKYHFLAIPSDLGGRFSVLSAVGTMPLLLCEVPMEQLWAGARSMRTLCKTNTNINPALCSAEYLVDQYKKGKHVLDIFIEQPRLWSLALWYRQLIGESLGKNQTTGFVPTITQATTDLHSVTQKVLGGPNDTITTFLYWYSEASLTLPQDHFMQQAQVPHTLSLNKLHSTILQGVKQAYKKQERAYREYKLDGTLFELGAFLQYKMYEIAFAAALLEVNPFDQPHVELYKLETRALLHKTE